MPPSYDGSLSDGRTAARLKVTVRLADEGLAIESEARGLVWAFNDLRLADERRRGQPVRLLNVAQADARLTIDDSAILRPLYAMAPHLRDPGVMGRRPGLRLAQWAAGIAAVILILFYGLPRAAEPVAALMPLEWEEAMGARVMREFSRRNKVCDGAAGRRALDRLTEQLTAVADTPYSFRVAVADTKAVNAFAAPGGYIVIFRGLIAAAETPDEVAGVLAHEMGHVIERHSTESMVRAAGLGLIVQILIGDPSGLAGLGAAAGEFLMTLAYSREAEAEADADAVDILAKAGIDARGLVRFLERMAQREGGEDGGLASFLSTHPRSAERAEAVRNTGNRGSQGMSDRDWKALRAICQSTP